MAKVVARIKVNGKHYEIHVDLDEALKIKAGKGDIMAALDVRQIYSDIKKGVIASGKDLMDAFGTSEVIEIARTIIVSGEVQKTQEFRDSEREAKVKQVINLVVKNAVDQNGRPYTEERIRRAATTSNADIVIVEVGGTVGDIEGLIFLEAIRQFRNDVGRENVAYVHVTLLPNLKATSEIKTKPTQHSVEILRGKGIQPDILVCRTEKTIPKAIKEKLSLYTDVAIESVIECRDQKSIYEVPIALEKEELAERIMDKLCLVSSPPDLTSWQEIVNKLKKPEGVGGKKVVKIAIVGKYVRLSDSYISVVEAINHAALSVGVEPEIKWILSDELDHKVDLKDLFSDVDGVIVPGGFGDRGIEGKINAIKHVRENKIPFLGLCLGMQCAVIEFARNVCGLTGANSTEFSSDTLHPVIDLMPAQESITQKGGTMRLGRYPCLIMPGTKAMAVYDQEVIYERHRHRYELNNFYREKLNLGGMVFSGVSPDNTLVELIEIKNHPYFTGSQFHPEFKSRPEKPHPLFVGFVKSMVGLPLLDESKTESKTSQK